MMQLYEEPRRSRWTSLFRSALFPLIVIVLLVYLASQTLLPDRDDDKVAVAYSDLKRLVRESPQQVELVVFVPEAKAIEVTLADGREYGSHYPSDASQVAFERLLDENGVRYDSRGTGESAWWSFLTYLLPFILFFGFWIFLMKNVERVRPRGARADDDRSPAFDEQASGRWTRR